MRGTSPPERLDRAATVTVGTLPDGDPRSATAGRHMGGEGEPVKGLKPTLISILAIGLLAGSAVGVAAQDDPMAPEKATGTVSPLVEGPGARSSPVGPGTLYEGRLFTHTWDATDSRLSGEASMTANTIQYATDGMEVGEGVWSLENDGGRWAGTGTLLGLGPVAHAMVVLHGEDGYEGLSAHVLIQFKNESRDVEDGTFSAGIFPADIPEIPAAE
jgi:hypothetical protein